MAYFNNALVHPFPTCNSLVVSVISHVSWCGMYKRDRSKGKIAGLAIQFTSFMPTQQDIS